MLENVFSYGTLQTKPVQLKLFGRTMDCYPDVLTGYKHSLIKIEDELVIAESGMTHYQNILYTGNPLDTIRGMVINIKETELQQADEYEKTAGYTRIRVDLESGKTAWVFLHPDTH
ncbi:MAG TPA: gamma-glutamylcyclotransferase family protein [Ferruginibacter sp.]|nr:gamma-glutamylcyclotransferase family protein [Ferruginibacter sp.]